MSNFNKVKVSALLPGGSISHEQFLLSPYFPDEPSVTVPLLAVSSALPEHSPPDGQALHVAAPNDQ